MINSFILITPNPWICYSLNPWRLVFNEASWAEVQLRCPFCPSHGHMEGFHLWFLSTWVTILSKRGGRACAQLSTGFQSFLGAQCHRSCCTVNFTLLLKRSGAGSWISPSQHLESFPCFHQKSVTSCRSLHVEKRGEGMGMETRRAMKGREQAAQPAAH